MKFKAFQIELCACATLVSLALYLENNYNLPNKFTILSWVTLWLQLPWAVFKLLEGKFLRESKLLALCLKSDLNSINLWITTLRPGHTRRQVAVTWRRDRLQRQVALCDKENFCENLCPLDRVFYQWQVAHIQTSFNLCNLPQGKNE